LKKKDNNTRSFIYQIPDKNLSVESGNFLNEN